MYDFHTSDQNNRYTCDLYARLRFGHENHSDKKYLVAPTILQAIKCWTKVKTSSHVFKYAATPPFTDNAKLQSNYSVNKFTHFNNSNNS